MIFVNLAIMKKGLIKASPWILMGLGTVSHVGTVIFAVKATPKAILLLEEAEKEKLKTTGEQLTLVEKAKATWKPYIPTLLMGATTIACFWGAQGINFRRNAALVSLYSVAEHTLRQYQEKVIETIGEKKAGEVLAKVDRQALSDNPASKAQVIITGNGDYLCYEKLSGRYLQSDIEKLRRAQNDFNQQIIGGEMYKSLNEWYDAISMPPISMGYDTGFTVDNLVDLRFSTQLSDDEKPCLVIDYYNFPQPNYNKVW